MTAMKQRLELTWVGKGDSEPAVEPRILIHDSTKDCGDPNSENMLIHGDNLITLKSIEGQFAGRIKCIYIDPPYNTGDAFEHYDDNLEHSIWLKLMKARLEILRNLLCQQGSIWIQIDDNEQAYLKVLCDEIFGRKNFINMVSVNMKNSAGASGGGEDKRMKKNCEYILAYAKDYNSLSRFNGPYLYTEISELIRQYEEAGKGWGYNYILLNPGDKEYIGSTTDGSGEEIKVYIRKNIKIVSIKQIIKDWDLTLSEIYHKYGEKIFGTTNAQTSIRDRIIDFRVSHGISENVVSVEYVPRTGKNRGKVYEQFYKGDTCRLFVWVKDTSEMIDGKIYKKDLQGTYWDMNPAMKGLGREGGVSFPNGKKPEQLIRRIFEMTTMPGEWILDSFLGSGTSAAVAHKIGRKYIGIEFGNHCYSHCVPRLRSVIEGEQTGISKAVNWEGGGGFKFYELGPSLIEHDKYGNPVISKQFNAVMLITAVARLNGYEVYAEPDVFWKQGYSQDRSYIYVTTNYVDSKMLDSIANEIDSLEKLLICAPAYDEGLNRRYNNIQLKKIPQSVLNKCDYAVKDYNLNIVEVFETDEDEE